MEKGIKQVVDANKNKKLNTATTARRRNLTSLFDMSMIEKVASQYVTLYVCLDDEQPGEVISCNDEDDDDSPLMSLYSV